jgi:hypothetical protein
MGNASAHTFTTTPSQQVTLGDLRERLQEDLPKLIYVEGLANGKFLKSHRCKVDGVGVVLKVRESCWPALPAPCPWADLQPRKTTCSLRADVGHHR